MACPLLWAAVNSDDSYGESKRQYELKSYYGGVSSSYASCD